MKSKIFTFKQRSADFLVEEILPFELSGNWNLLFVYFEKRNLNTIDVLNFIIRTFKIPRMAIWIGWLKDKKAITRQRLCIYKDVLKKSGGEKNFVQTISQLVKILKLSYHSVPLDMTSWVKNKFSLVLKANKKLSKIEKDLSEKILKNIFENWFMNLYWNQRFWIRWRNVQDWIDILEWKKTDFSKTDNIFKIQAFVSKIFNYYVFERNKTNFKLIQWDICNNYENLWQKKQILSWPVFWFDLKMPEKDTKSFQFENNFLKKYIKDKYVSIFEQMRIYWIRRDVFTYPKLLSLWFEWDNIKMKFILNSWVYASVLIDEMLYQLDMKLFLK